MGILKKNANTEANANSEAVAAVMTPQFESDETLGQPEAAVEAKPAAEVVKEEVQAEASTKEEAAPAAEPEAKSEQKAEAVKEEAAPAAEKPKAEAKSEQKAAAPAVLKMGNHILAKATGDINPFPALKDALKTVGVDYDYSTFPRYRNEAGVFTSGDDVEAGTFLELQVISYSSYWVVTPGSDDKSDKTKKAVRYSNDGVTINSSGEDDKFAGMTCQEYLDVLKEQGYENASVKEYVEVFGFMLDAERAECKDLNTIISLSLSPQSRSKFTSYQTNRIFLVKIGRVKNVSANPVVRFTSQRQKGDKTTYYISVAEEGKSEPLSFEG